MPTSVKATMTITVKLSACASPLVEMVSGNTTSPVLEKKGEANVGGWVTIQLKVHAAVADDGDFRPRPTQLARTAYGLYRYM